MKKILFNIMLLTVLMLGVGTAQAWAQNKPIKGNWIFTIQTPAGALPVPFSFKAKGKGSFITPSGALQLAYREKGAAISIALEAPGLAPDGSDITIVVRGNKTDDKTITANGIIIFSTPDTANPTGFMTAVSPITGARQ
ncbi:MAG: hypothetical protein AB1489_34815 [Acidobacteriota bacterium]